MRFEMCPLEIDAAVVEPEDEGAYLLFESWVMSRDTTCRASIDYMSGDRLHPRVWQHHMIWLCFSRPVDMTPLWRLADRRLRQGLRMYSRLLREFDIPEPVRFKLLKQRAAAGSIFTGAR